MGLKSLREGHKRSFGLRCCVSRVIETIDKKDLDFLLGALNYDSGYTHTEIARALQEDGFEYVSTVQVGRHRRGDCSCEKVEAGK